MNVLIINGSPHESGHCARVISIVSEVFSSAHITLKEHRVTDFSAGGCLACGGCKSGGGCVLDDIKKVSDDLRASDGVLVVTPVYYGSPNGSVISFLDRLFQSSKFDKRMKVGAAFVTARRGGCTASFDAVNKYFAMSEMPIATSTYWNLMHTGGDEEGERTAATLARNMAFLMKSIKLGKERLGF